MDAQELQEPKKVLKIWIKNLNKIVNKVNHTKLSMIDMKPKDETKLGTLLLDKCIKRKLSYMKMGYIYIHMNLAKNMEIKKDGPRILSGVKMLIDKIKLCNNQVIWSSTIYMMDPTEILCVKN